MRAFSYCRPSSLEEACRILGNGENCFPLGGGTDLLIAMREGLVKAHTLVDLKHIPQLQGLEPREDGGLWIGAAVPLYRLEGDPYIRRTFPILAAAAQSVASYQIRNRATVGGNVLLDTRCRYYNQSDYNHTPYHDCRKRGGETCYAVPGGDRCYARMCSDLLPALTALRASATIASGDGGIRTVDLEEFFSGDGIKPHVLMNGEVLIGLEVPAHQGVHHGVHQSVHRGLSWAYLKHQWRRSVDFSLLTLAVTARRDESGAPASVRVVLGGAGSAPVRVYSAEELIAGGGSDAAEIAEEAAREVKIYQGVYAGPGYSRRLVRVLVEDAVEDLQSRR